MVQKRQQLSLNQFQDLICRVAQQIIWLAADIVERTGKLEVRGDDALDPIDFADIKMDEGEYVVAIDAVSGLPQTTAGKLDLIETLAKVPGFPPDRILQVYDSLDPEAEVALETAAQRAIDKDLESIVEDGKSVPPEPYYGPEALQAGVKRAQALFCQGRLKKAPEAHLKLLAAWMDDASDLAKSLTAPPPAPTAPAPPPGAPPMPAPVPTPAPA
jgi:hypothetical protein